MNELTKSKSHSLPTRGLSLPYAVDVQIFNTWLHGRPVSMENIAAFFQHRAETCKPSTVRKNRAAIKKALRLSLGNDISVNELMRLNLFFDGIQPSRVNVAVTDNKILNKQEINKLINAAGYKTGLIIRALYETACRVSELCNIEIKNCHSGRKEITIEIYRQKTKTSDTVFMSKDLFNEIKKAYAGKRFLFEVNGKPLSRFTVHGLIKHAGEKIGRPDIHAHTLRHSWATDALPALGLSKVSKYLGHARQDTTARYYLHGRPSEEEVTAFNALHFAI